MENLKETKRRRFQTYKDLKTQIDRFKQIDVSVEYSLGGINYFSGNHNPRGYRVSLKPCNVNPGTYGSMVEYTLMSADPKVDGGYIFIEAAARYNKKRLQELAELIDPKVDDIVAAYEADNKQLLTQLCRDGIAQEFVNPEAIKPVQPQKSSMMLLTKEIKKKMPKLGSYNGTKPELIPIAVKFFDPTGSWTWYAIEGNPTGEIIQDGAFKGEEDYKFFGYVKGFEGELGYFTLGLLSAAKAGLRGLKSLPIERDRHFSGTLAEVMRENN